MYHGLYRKCTSAHILKQKQADFKESRSKQLVQSPPELIFTKEEFRSLPYDQKDNHVTLISALAPAPIKSHLATRSVHRNNSSQWRRLPGKQT